MRGDALLEIEKSKSDLDVSYVLRQVRAQGATDDDIKEWWNMPNEEWSDIIEDDDKAKYVAVKMLTDEGATYEEAVEKLKRSFPFYATYEPGYSYSNNGPLPYELKVRINKYANSLSDEAKEILKEDLKNYSSMNAYIRVKIKEGLI